MIRYWRFAVAVALLTGTALFLQGRNKAEIIPAHLPLASFPRVLAGWTSVDIPLTKDTLDVLGPGDFLLRDYRESTSGAIVNLFVAYFPTQRAGDTIHSPKNCLPGAGWAPVQADRTAINVPGHAPFTANRYLIGKGDQRELVLYWYWAHDRVVASEYAAKFYLVADSIRTHRTDGSLIRVSVPLVPGEDMEYAQQKALTLTADIVPLINAYVPR